MNNPMTHKKQGLLQKLICASLVLGLNFSIMNDASAITIILVSPEPPKIAKTKPVDMAEVEKAIEASKAYKGEVSCGKIDEDGKRYTLRIPIIYQWVFGMEYSGDSPWAAGGIKKKKDPCQYDVGTIVLSFLWPAMTPYNKEGTYVYSDVKKIPNKMTAVFRAPGGFHPGGANAKHRLGILELSVLGYSSEIYDRQSREDITPERALALGEYLPELGLYHHTFEIYYGQTDYMKSQGYTKLDHNKREVFWALDAEGQVSDLIVCKYLDLDINKLPFKETICEHSTLVNLFMPKASIQFRYASDYLRDWKLIRQAAILQYQAFTTVEVLP